MQPLMRWLGNHLGTLILAFILALAVWISAVVSTDPNEERTLRPINLEVIGQPSDSVVVNQIPNQVRLTLNAPRSIWSKLNDSPELIQAWIDLTGIQPGEHTLTVKTKVDISPFRFIRVEPSVVQVRLEPLVQREIPVQFVISGDLPLGYRRGEPEIQPEKITISGPKSAVDKVKQARAELNISGSVESIRKIIPIEIFDAEGKPVSGLTVSNNDVSVLLPVSLLGRFKNVAVKVLTTGQVANGYRLTNISVSPPTFTVFSENPELINDLPGFVETMPVDLENLEDDALISIDLNLPEGITTVKDPNVMVQVSVAAIEGSLTLTLPVEIVGLTPDLQATLSPENVDVIVAGPLFVLDQLSEEDFKVIVDLTGLPLGIYQRSPTVESYPEQVRVQTTLPETIEVTIETAPTLTPSPTNLTPAVTPTATLTRTPIVVPATNSPTPTIVIP
jgi:YbbR domain-containing protein